MVFLKASEKDKEMASRLKEIRVALFGPRGGVQMAKFLCLTQPSYQQYETAKVRIPHRIMALLAEKKKVNPLWLLTGKGSRFLDGEHPAQVVAEAEAPYGGLVRVPVYESVGAGSPREALETPPDRYIYIDREFAGAGTKCLRVQGNSMYPAIPDGSIVGVDIQKRSREDLQHRKIFVLWVRGEGMVVRRLHLYGKDFSFLPDNTTEENRSYIYTHKDREAIIIQGRAEWVLNQLNP